ncbi:MAG: UDP-3-O-acyl-N-acetylglucosamine deacetylase [Simkaniaceae bacterium]|nr:UDP-3-O-acyl-N-acetylglucosamine deacetylase [Simkaniaceae bacterium]MCF7851899.1 UDP-3-O-acyl-N-acetylglucosamine deacetylase [Simkaniaceae bacterium]
MRFSLLSSYTYTPSELLAHLPSTRNQCTIANSFVVDGIGLFTGVPVRMTVYPAETGHGIVFKRIDLPSQPTIPALVEYVDDTPRCTILSCQGANIQTVEHILAALRAHNIDNALIEVNGPEIPAADGSARYFVDQIKRVGIGSQDELVQIMPLTKPIYWTKGGIHLVAIPCEEYRISYTLSYPGHPLLDAQFYSLAITPEGFDAQIASSRTFSLFEEVTPLLEKGLIKGGSLDNGVIIKGRDVLNPEGLRFPNEMVRHKILDLVGDLFLVGFPFTAHVFAVRSGHASNAAFARELRQYFDQIECE